MYGEKTKSKDDKRRLIIKGKEGKDYRFISLSRTGALEFLLSIKCNRASLGVTKKGQGVISAF